MKSNARTDAMTLLAGAKRKPVKQDGNVRARIKKVIEILIVLGAM